MNKKKILILTVLLIAVMGITINSSSATIKIPTKYKTKTFTNYYYISNTQYEGGGEFTWLPTKTKFNNYAIHEKFYNSKTKVNFYIYNNNGNNIHWTDCRSSKLTIKYKIVTNSNSISKTKIYNYNKIPKYGLTKTITLTGPKNSNVLISSIKWSQVHRVWY